jgi:serine O-acetyltransferase
MNFEELRQLVRSDLYRHTGAGDLTSFLRCLASTPGFNCTFWFRVVEYASDRQSAFWFISPLLRFIKRHFAIKYGIAIPRFTRIGPGLYIAHHGEIVLHADCRIGRDCNISQGVTLGQANRGPRAGAPSVGDRVYIGPGAKVVGAVRIGSDVAIGANAVVTDDVPDNAVVVGVPAHVISYAGSVGYVNRTDYS